METHKPRVDVTGRDASSASGPGSGLDYDPDRTPARTESRPGGFSGTCETTLTDWIQLVQMGRRDAVVNVRTHEGKEGKLWCRDGDIIDAACDGLVGEDAVYRALSWQGGRVSVDFQDFEHRRKIHTPTAGLLLGAAYRMDTGVPGIGHLQDPPDGLDPPEIVGLGSSDTAIVEDPQPVHQRRLRNLVWLLASAGGLLPFVLLSVVAWRWFHSDNSALPTAPAPVASFSVRIETDPAQAAILLDGKQVGVGRLEKSLPRDGVSHEILSSAPGYVSERLVFRDAPPRQSVVLSPRETIVITARASTTTEVPRVRKIAPAPPARASGVLAHRSIVAARARPSSATAPSAASSTVPERPRESAPAAVKIHIIEERRPGIQIIDNPKPRIDVVQ